LYLALGLSVTARDEEDDCWYFSWKYHFGFFEIVEMEFENIKSKSSANSSTVNPNRFCFLKPLIRSA
jgi:hypothetical protein